MRKNDGTQCPRNIVFVQTIGQADRSQRDNPMSRKKNWTFGVAHWTNYQNGRFHHWSKDPFHTRQVNSGVG